MQIRSVGIDLGRTTFQLIALGASGKVLPKKKFTQKQLLAFTAIPLFACCDLVKHNRSQSTYRGSQTNDI
jgi:hypothetical protein